MDRRDLLAAAGLTGLLLPLAARAAIDVPRRPAVPDASFALWPEEAPGLLDAQLRDHVVVRNPDPGFPDRAMDHVRTPAPRPVPGGGPERRGDAGHPRRRLCAGSGRQGGL